MPGWLVLPASGSYLGGADGPDVETLPVGLQTYSGTMDMVTNSEHHIIHHTAGRGWVRGTWAPQLGQGAECSRGRKEVGVNRGRKGEVGGGHKWVEDIDERRGHRILGQCRGR